MKQFLKYLLASFFALFLFFGGLFFLFVGLFSVFEKAPLAVEENSMFVLDMSMNITDAPPSKGFSDLIGEMGGAGKARSHSVRDVAGAIRAAAEDDRISSLFLHGNFTPMDHGSGFAVILEVHEALQYFSETGKPVVAHIRSPHLRDYYLASAADTVIVDPYGVVALNGLASQQVFFAEALEKFGVGVQVVRAGAYKSAVEPFNRREISEENREQTLELLNELWETLLASIAGGRGMEVDRLRELSETQGWFPADEARESGLADRVGYFDEVQAYLAETHGVGAFAQVSQVDLASYLGVLEERSANRRASAGRVAVVYLEGSIVDGEGARNQVGGDRFSRELRRLRQESDVDAVVVRVNSPGGSAAASETIQREIALTRERKPVVVSFGSMAASGGYWVATEADRIFAQPNTITGSIGVWGILPNIEGLSESVGVYWDTVKTSPYADLFSIVRPRTEGEMELVQGFVDRVYRDFLERVASGRDMEIEEVQGLADGRIWSGVRALEIGLVDELGGLSAAISDAAARAGLGETFEIVEFPRARKLRETLAELIEEPPPVVETALRDMPLWKELQMFQSLNDPQGVYMRLPYDLHLK